MLEERTLNFIFALVVGKSVRGAVKGKRPLSNIWNCQSSVRYYVTLLTDSDVYKMMLASVTNHVRAKSRAE